MHFGRGVEADLERATELGKRKKPLSEAERKRRREEVFARWFDEKPERRYRDPMKG